MEKYVIMFQEGMGLFDNYNVIEGKNPKDALKKAFNKDFRRLTGDEGRYATIILVKGDIEGNNLRYKGRYQKLCYAEIN